jgi:hypothetical protein
VTGLLLGMMDNWLWPNSFKGLNGLRRLAEGELKANNQAIAALFQVMNRYVGNLPPMPGVFLDYPAPVVRNGIMLTSRSAPALGNAASTTRRRFSRHQFRNTTSTYCGKSASSRLFNVQAICPSYRLSSFRLRSFF